MLRCLDKEILKKFNDDGLSSFTTEEQVCLFINRKINKQTKLKTGKVIWQHVGRQTLKIKKNIKLKLNK